MVRVATFISHIFEPALLIPIAFLACTLKTGVPFVWACLWLLAFMVPTLWYRLWAKAKQGLDWDMHDRTKRIKPLLALVVFLVISLLIISILEPRLIGILTLFLVWISGFFLITAGWTKISGHTGGDALAVGMIVLWYGWNFWPLLLIVPIVAWARVVRKDHTVFQVILGATYSFLVLFAANVLGY
jgi:hypothetical protein